MRTLVIYSSQTGFTERYAEWIAARLNADVLTVKEAKKKKQEFFDQYDAYIYGGWIMAGTVVDSKWFLQKASDWKNKKLAIYCVGGSPAGNPDLEDCLSRLLTEEQSNYIMVFYCQGGIDYSKMKASSRFVMKTLASSLSKKKDATQKDRDMAEMISHSYDSSDEKFIEPIVQYMEACE